MKHCLWCDESYYEELSWKFILGLNVEQLICKNCKDSIERINGEICSCCGRKLTTLSPQYIKGDHCYDCYRWENDEKWANLLTKNRSLYHYNEFLKDIITRYKFRGDYIMAQAFQQDLKNLYYTEFKNHIIVPIPLSDERLYERGFNQAKHIAELLDQPIHELLNRSTHKQKQSKKSRQARIATSKQIFNITPNVQSQIKGQQILLIDDIYTTGATLRQAAKTLKTNQAKTINSLTLARS